MSLSQLNSNLTPIILEVEGSDRWTIYHRLQELDIPCECQINEPLKVSIESPLSGIQIRSVVQQITAPRWVLQRWLQRCWEH